MITIGHRGCRGLLPENTIESFKEAIRMGVDAIELDVVVSGDNQIVVSHEPFMSRTICLKPEGEEITLEEDKKYNLYQMSYDEIQQFITGEIRHPKFPNQKRLSTIKPLLIDAINSCEEFIKKRGLKPIDYIIEIKSKSELYDKFQPEPESYATLILDTLEKINTNRVVLKSFDVNILNALNKKKKGQKLSLLINRNEVIDDKIKKVRFKPEILGPYFKLIDRTNVKDLKSRGFKIIPWTINDVTDMIRLKSYGVDGVITDYPNRLLGLDF